MKYLLHTLFALNLYLFSSPLQSSEPFLQDIRQLTFSHMGFEKAGEAYFSPDSTMIIFQAVPKGEKNYQIYTLKIGEEKPILVRTGKGSCTCAFFRPDGKKIIFASSHSDPLTLKKEEKTSDGKYVWDLTPYVNNSALKDGACN